jgi:hypothetical protein
MARTSTVKCSRSPSDVTHATLPGRKESRGDVSASDLNLANFEDVEGRDVTRAIDLEDRKFNDYEHVEGRDMAASNQVTDLEDWKSSHCSFSLRLLLPVLLAPRDSKYDMIESDLQT